MEREQTWQGVVRLTQTATVADGARLTIRPGTRVVVSAGAGLSVRGLLSAEGQPGPGQILFFPEGAWGGLELAGSARAVLSNVRLEGPAPTTLRCLDAATLEATGLKLLEGATGLRCAGHSRARLTDATVCDHSQIGVLADESARVALVGGAFLRNATAVTCVGSARLSADACRFQGSSQCGVNAMSRSAVTLRACRFEANRTAVGACEDARADVRECELAANLVGVHAKNRGLVNVWRNRFHPNAALDVDIIDQAVVRAVRDELAAA